ncbi:MAG: hypothetical protein SP4CHLAM5_03400 [Chlamydiia bacterium]|nr:hypothetical protein [Chlamydiia bacterium]MCH9618214.1 hypothetical protein [Chlamydiia bacterium]MCH9624063.1 hypothetical protein [Chlamydiia bacterium]
MFFNKFFIGGISFFSVQSLFLFGMTFASLTEDSLKENKHRLSPNSLNHYAYCKYSQWGEDGIIEEIFNRLNISSGFFVEFGGADGIEISNTRKLWEEGWDGCYIEADNALYQKLLKNYQDVDNILCLNYFVTWHRNDQRGLCFDDIKRKHFPQREIDFLSIDIDGGDFYILKALECRPKVICIENNLNWHPLYDKEVPEQFALANNQQPLEVLIAAARKQGYQPVCMTINLFLVRDDLYEAFAGVPNDTLTIWKDAWRAYPDKKYFLNKRRQNTTYMKMEGKKINETFPITIDS